MIYQWTNRTDVWFFFAIRLTQCCRNCALANEKQHKKPRNPVKCPPFCPIVVVNIMTSAMNFGDAMMQPHHCYGALKGQGTEGLLHMNDIRVRHELRIRVKILGYNSHTHVLMMSHTWYMSKSVVYISNWDVLFKNQCEMLTTIVISGISNPK